MKNYVAGIGKDFTLSKMNTMNTCYSYVVYNYIDTNRKYDVTYRFISLTTLVYAKLYSSNVEWIIN